MRLIRPITLSLLVGVFAACGSSEAGFEGDGSQGIPLDALPVKYAAAFCTAYDRCFGQLLGVFRPGEDCAETTTTPISEELPLLEEAVDAKRVTYDGTKMQACLDDIAARNCAGLLERESAECMAAIDGTVANGGDCSLDAECAGEAYCNSQDSCPGVCARLESAGGRCRSDSECASGLVCFGQTNRCVAPAGSGELCKQGEPDCAPGYVCLGEDGPAKSPGNCVALDDAFSVKLGQSCDLDTELCEIGSSCEVQTVLPQVTTECAAKVGSGAACKVAIPDECPDDEYCLIPLLPPTLDGTCEPKPEAGQPCGGAGYDPARTPSICAPYARCDDGVCRDLAHLGESCNVDATCYSGRCTGGACIASTGCD